VVLYSVDYVLFQRAFEPRLEEEIKGLLWGEILGQEVMYTQFDSDLVERVLQLGKHLSIMLEVDLKLMWTTLGTECFVTLCIQWTATGECC